MNPSTLRTILVAAAAIALAFLLFMLVAYPASSQEPYPYYTPDHIDLEKWENRKALRSHRCFWYGLDCPGQLRLRHLHSRWPLLKTTILPKCRATVRVVGPEANTETGAQTLAERAWFNAVRHDLGVKFSNLDRSKNYKRNCNPSTVTQLVKRLLWICVIEAIPCEAEMPDNVKDKRPFRDHEFD